MTGSSQKEATLHRKHVVVSVRGRADLQDALSALPDRKELERLFDRETPLTEILKLAGHQVGRDRIDEILDSPDPSHEIRRLLGP